jgi:serralysin
MLHELGHGLGLKHSGNVSENETPPFLSAALDTQDYTIMSYNHGAYSSATAPSTPMILDIAALHHMYGANHAYNAGNSIYSYNGGSLVATLWDGGGSDTISSVGYSGNATIDLREGVNSVSHIGNTHLWNAFGANIENAQTGGGSDTVTGNALANTVESNGGNDTVNGRAGNDVLFGGDGNDSVRGGNDNDFINGNMGADQVYGDAGNDTVRGGKGVDVVYGNAGDDQLFGDFDNDTVYGEAGNDLLRGGKGDDTLIGADGNDIFWGDLGNDQMQGGAGNDIFVFLTGSGVDRIADFAGAGAVVGDKILFSSQIFATTAAALAAVTYSEGNATMSLGSGSTLTLSGVSGGLTVDDFQII